MVASPNLPGTASPVTASVIGEMFHQSRRMPMTKLSRLVVNYSRLTHMLDIPHSASLQRLTGLKPLSASPRSLRKTKPLPEKAIAQPLLLVKVSSINPMHKVWCAPAAGRGSLRESLLVYR